MDLSLEIEKENWKDSEKEILMENYLVIPKHWVTKKVIPMKKVKDLVKH
jgi:hypothetical protein